MSNFDYRSRFQVPDYTARFRPPEARRRRRRRTFREPVPPPAPVIPGYSLPADDEERLTALEWIIDRLSTGQYVTANVAEDLLEGDWDAPIRKGLSGERRGDWTNVLFGGESSAAGREEQRGLVPSEHRLVRGVGGLVANVVLDPTTYLGFGSTAAARAGAKGFARAARNQALRQLSDPVVTQRIFGGRAARASSARAQRLNDIGDAPLQQYLSRVYRDAYREGLTTPQDALRRRYLGRLQAERESTVAARAGAAAGDGGAWKQAVGKEADERLKALDLELAKVRDEESWLHGVPGDADFTGFRSLGEQRLSFLGRDLARWQAGPVRRQVAEVGAAIRRAGREAPGLKPFLDAWWRSRTHGVIGQVTRLLGFPRTGYQRALRQIELAQESDAQDLVHRNTARVEQAFEGVSDEVQGAYVKLMATVYDYVGKALKGVDQSAPGWRAQLEAATRAALDDRAVRAVVPEETLEPALELWSRVKTLTDEWHLEEGRLAAQGLIRGAGYVANYLPIQWRPVASQLPEEARKRGSMVFSPLLERHVSFGDARTQEARKLAGFFGLPDESALAVIDQNRGALITSARQLLIGRAVANARMRGRANLLTQMRSFGLDVKAYTPGSTMAGSIPQGSGQSFRTVENDEVRAALVNAYENGRLDEIGLHAIPGEKYLEGWVFDKDVRDMLERTVRITGDEMHVLGRALRGYTRWLQGILTLRPGFHVRNILSNQVMVFLREGLRAFQPRYLHAGMVGAAHELAGQGQSKIVARADSVLSRMQARRALSWRFGEHSVAELAEYARQKGVISRISKTGEPDEVLGMPRRERSRANPLRWQQGAFEASQNVGALVESSQRFSMFLMEVDKLRQPGLRLTEGELEFAAFEARKWMVDYQDLTEFEQRYLRLLRPFYAWFRHAVPNMIAGIVDAPQLYSAAFKGQESLEEALAGDVDIDPRLVPDLQRESGSIVLGRGENGKVVMGNLGLPFTDINLFALSFPEPGGGGWGMPRVEGKALLRELFNAAHPALKTGVEVALEEDLFTGKPLTGAGRVPRAMRGLEAMPRVLQLLDGVARQFSPRGLGFTDDNGVVREDRRGRLVMDAKMAQVLRNHFPVLEWLGRAIDGPVWLADRAGAGIEDALDRTRLGRDDWDGFDEFLRILSFWAGVSGRQIDPREERRRLMQRAEADRRRAASERRRYRPVRIREGG